MGESGQEGAGRTRERPIEDLVIDETSLQKRYECVTMVTDRNSGTIIEVLDDRKTATLKEWLEQNRGQLQAVRSVSMNLFEPFINAVRETIEGAEEKICFERFHVAAYFGKALEKIRATAHREPGEGDEPSDQDQVRLASDQGEE
jgi:transposase